MIDFRQWHRGKQGGGIYIITRCNENMALIKCGDLPFDRADTINAGVLADELVGPSGSGVVNTNSRAWKPSATNPKNNAGPNDWRKPKETRPGKTPCSLEPSFWCKGSRSARLN